MAETHRMAVADKVVAEKRSDLFSGGDDRSRLCRVTQHGVGDHITVECPVVYLVPLCSRIIDFILECRLMEISESWRRFRRLFSPSHEPFTECLVFQWTGVPSLVFIPFRGAPAGENVGEDLVSVFALGVCDEIFQPPLSLLEPFAVAGEA